eukprot:TRINITY_DN14484_c1_g1_i5.p1 TRINITY_DN14484_c1_g1~~TRINITY_DN14484_c1_g1_i5.p1  ORF type:complete len:344 (-),score=43.26 TRINITY_DN14484_c1_g1_i5:179-1210(-)
MLKVRVVELFLLIVIKLVECTAADTNFLTGANDIIVVENQDGELQGTPFSVQFGKKDIWLPRSGHIVSLKVNGEVVPVSMTLNSEGQGYFSTLETRQNKYRFWSALLGMSDPLPHQMTDTATNMQLTKLNLKMGENLLEYQVVTSSGSIVSTDATIFMLNNTQKFVVSDIDGTVTRSNIRGLLLPALGISDWKHDGVVQLYSKIADQGYKIIYLTSRAIGQSESTREYLFNLREKGGFRMPVGPVMMQVNSIIDTVKTEVIDQDPEVQKIAKLARVRGLFASNPLFAGYGNQDSDIIAYKALNIDLNRIFRLDEESNLRTIGTGLQQNVSQHILDVSDIYPTY